ncbi:hypothetical protein HDU85_002413 [Gaertneriomyces sp. JEL0708]|nr:hypothetical protein HDU85_002413 [Gaertneriomyces sp. JEL0708]
MSPLPTSPTSLQTTQETGTWFNKQKLKVGTGHPALLVKYDPSTNIGTVFLATSKTNIQSHRFLPLPHPELATTPDTLTTEPPFPFEKQTHLNFTHPLCVRLHHVGGNSLNIIRHRKRRSPPPPPVGIRMMEPTTPKLTESAFGLFWVKHRAYHTARNNGASGSSGDKGADSGGSGRNKGRDGGGSGEGSSNAGNKCQKTPIHGMREQAPNSEPTIHLLQMRLGEEPDLECPEDRVEREGRCVDEPTIPWVAGDVLVDPLSYDENVSEGGYEGDTHSPVETLVIELLKVRSDIAV